MDIISFIHFFNAIGSKVDHPTINSRYGLTIDENNREVELLDFEGACYFLSKRVKLMSFSAAKPFESSHRDHRVNYIFLMDSPDWNFSISLCRYYFGMDIHDEIEEDMFKFLFETDEEVKIKKSNTRVIRFEGNRDKFISDIALLKLFAC